MIKEVNEKCRKAEIGCVQCKKMMCGNLEIFLEPIREKRIYYESRPDIVADIVITGSKEARQVAEKTMEEVRAAVKI